MQPGLHSRYLVFQNGWVSSYGLFFNMDAGSLMTLVIILKSSFLLFCMFTAVKEFVCLILSLVLLASSSARGMAVISVSSTDAESLSLMIISSSLCTYNFHRHPYPVT